MLEQDVAKGLGIVMLMALHTLTIAGSAYKIAGGLFGFILPFFFFIAGYNYHGSQYSYQQTIWRRFKQIGIPFLMYSIGVTVCASIYFFVTQSGVSDANQLPNTFINPITHEKELYSLSSVVKTYLTMFLTRSTAEQLGIKCTGTLYSCIMMFWFIQMLFSGTLVFHAVVDYALQSVAKCISVVIGLIGITMIFAHFDVHLPFYLCEAPCIAGIMILGAWFGQHNLLGLHAKKSVIVCNALVAYGIFLFLAWQFQGSGFIMSGKLWDVVIGEWSVPLTVVFAICGSYAFVHFCRLIVHMKYVGSGLIWCGQNSLRLLLVHGLVELFVCHIFNVPPFQTAVRAQQSNLHTIYVFIFELIISVLFVHFISSVKQKRKTRLVM